MKVTLERMAAEKGTSVSALVNEQIGIMLGQHTEIRDDTPYSLTTAERYLMMRMDELMAKLDHDHESTYMTNVTAFREGYTAEYSHIFAQMYKELSRQDCELVWDILDMIQTLRIGYDALDERDRSSIKESDCHYQGFDHNDPTERSMASYVTYLANTGRWEDTSDDARKYSDNGDSHYPMLPTYKGMLNAYREVKERRRSASPRVAEWLPLTAEELQFVIEDSIAKSSFRNKK